MGRGEEGMRNRGYMRFAAECFIKRCCRLWGVQSPTESARENGELFKREFERGIEDARKVINGKPKEET